MFPMVELSGMFREVILTLRGLNDTSKNPVAQVGYLATTIYSCCPPLRVNCHSYTASWNVHFQHDIGNLIAPWNLLVSEAIRPALFLRTALTHCGLVTPYCHLYPCQHWFRYWLVAWWHQAITWINFDLSSKVFCWIHLRAISWN